MVFNIDRGNPLGGDMRDPLGTDPFNLDYRMMREMVDGFMNPNKPLGREWDMRRDPLVSRSFSDMPPSMDYNPPYSLNSNLSNSLLGTSFPTNPIAFDMAVSKTLNTTMGVSNVPFREHFDFAYKFFEDSMMIAGIEIKKEEEKRLRYSASLSEITPVMNEANNVLDDILDNSIASKFDFVDYKPYVPLDLPDLNIDLPDLSPLVEKYEPIVPEMVLPTLMIEEYEVPDMSNLLNNDPTYYTNRHLDEMPEVPDLTSLIPTFKPVITPEIPKFPLLNLNDDDDDPLFNHWYNNRK